MNKCKFCGAKELFSENDYTSFDCGAHRYGENEWGQSIECLSRRLAQSEARGQELFEALALEVEDPYATVAVWSDAVDVFYRHFDHFRKDGGK
jgi:hypothetical protein